MCVCIQQEGLTREDLPSRAPFSGTLHVQLPPRPLHPLKAAPQRKEVYAKVCRSLLLFHRSVSRSLLTYSKGSTLADGGGDSVSSPTAEVDAAMDSAHNVCV